MKQPAPDLIVAGKYCLERQLAAGGMGSVWIARHLDLDLDIAIKFMDPECASEEGRTRFELEAKAAAHLQSPYVVNVLDYGVDEDLPYIVMELLNGEDLEDRLQREGRISLESAQKILAQAAKALRRAQELGVVHRDIKPHNLFLSKGDDDNEETLKILDFGIAKETGPALVGEGTNTGHIVGSPNYMSPEHVRGARDIDSRSDLWSLGVVLFQACTGRLPFPGDVVGDVIGMILADPIPRATDIAPDLPPGIDDFFFKALQRDRSLRFQSAKEMNDAFAELVRTSMPPGLSSGPSSLPVVRAARADAPTLSLEEVGAKAAITSAVPNEDTLAKNTVVDTKPAAARQSSMRKGVMAATAGLVITFAIVLVLLRVTEPAKTPEDPNAAATTPSGAPSGPAVAGQESRPASAPATEGSQQAAGTAPASGIQGASTQPAGLRPTSGGASSAASGSPETSPSEASSAEAAPTSKHVAGAPAFDVADVPRPTTKPSGKTPPTKSTAKPTGSGTPSWGF